MVFTSIITVKSVDIKIYLFRIYLLYRHCLILALLKKLKYSHIIDIVGLQIRESFQHENIF
jgi:hypothetical protein